jgi:hypothetical protein
MHSIKGKKKAQINDALVPLDSLVGYGTGFF